MTKDYTVAVQSGAQILYATDGTGEGWTDVRGLVAGLTAAARDGAVAAAIAAGMAYDIIERDTLPPYTRTRVGGTATLLTL